MSQGDCDVLVVGGGLAGVTAALAAASTGAKVVLSRRAWGATALCGGLWDAAWQPALGEPSQAEGGLNAAPAPHSTVDAHLADIALHRPRHPYARMGLPATRKHLLAGWQRLAVALAGLDSGPLPLPPLQLELPPALYLGALGALFASSAMPGQASGLPQHGSVAVVGLGGMGPNIDRLVAGWQHDGRRLGRALPQWCALTLAPTTSATSYPQLAIALENPETFAFWAAGLKAALSQAAGARRLEQVWLPPVLGMGAHRQLHQRLQDILQLPVAEMVAPLPSVPGMRLQRALDAALVAAGISLRRGEASAQMSGRRLLSTVGDDGSRCTPGALVLASGRFVGGGIIGPPRPREALLGLPVTTEFGSLQDASLPQVVRGDPSEPHPLMTAGVRINSAGHAFDADQAPLDNVTAAGMVIGGFAGRYSRCAAGVALATGHLAGLSAAQAASSFSGATGAR